MKEFVNEDFTTFYHVAGISGAANLQQIGLLQTCGLQQPFETLNQRKRTVVLTVASG